jgi:tetratricopeptide (TPR) repeat protein
MVHNRFRRVATTFSSFKCAGTLGSVISIVILMSASWHSLPASAESDSALMKKAVEEYRAGHFADAAGNFYATLTTKFNEPMVHYYMASCYVHLEDPESAVREFRIAYALAPNTDVGYYSKTALKYFVFNADGSAIRLSKKEKKGSPASTALTGAASGSGGATTSAGETASNGTNASAAVAGSKTESTSGATSTAPLSKSAELIQSQAQREKDSRLTQSAKLAEEINKRGNERVNNAVAGLSSDPLEREQQLLKLPDDVRAMLNNLRYEYDTRRQKQLDLGKVQADKLDESATNLQSLIDQHQSVQAGSNLYIRNYKKGASKGSKPAIVPN